MLDGHDAGVAEGPEHKGAGPELDFLPRGIPGPGPSIGGGRLGLSPEEVREDVEDQVGIGVPRVAIGDDKAALVGDGPPVFLDQAIPAFDSDAGEPEDKTGVGRPDEGCNPKEGPALLPEDYVDLFPGLPDLEADGKLLDPAQGQVLR